MGDTTKLHYSQTTSTARKPLAGFCTSTKLHYSQTISNASNSSMQFCTSTKLHYSQTNLFVFEPFTEFCTSTKLHYSQTAAGGGVPALLFCTSTKLHYSQTSNSASISVSTRGKSGYEPPEANLTSVISTYILEFAQINVNSQAPFHWKFFTLHAIQQQHMISVVDCRFQEALHIRIIKKAAQVHQYK